MQVYPNFDNDKNPDDFQNGKTPNSGGQSNSPSDADKSVPVESPKKPFKANVDLAALKRAAKKALTRVREKRQTGDSINFSSRYREAGQAAYQLIKAQYPELNDTDRLTFIMLVASGLIEASPRPKFATLDTKSYCLIKGELATLLNGLRKYEEQLLDIDLYPEDPERTEKIANLSDKAESQIDQIEKLAERLARLAMLPEIPKDPNQLRLTAKLAEKIKRLEAQAKPDMPLWTLARKLLTPYLP